ncbi:MAG: hypothetical protein RQ899_08805 [Pseudomonadales bacterium]|nr:hypothetical protein [Pseudomonadales bacterium]
MSRFSLGKLGYYWGITGVVAILILAIVRVGAKVVEMSAYPLNLLHWIVLVSFTLYMAFAEGYRGFHCNFAPRVVVRGDYLSKHPSPLLLVLAPLVCFGYIHATARRKIISFSVTAAIVVLVLLVGMMPQPWRGIVDAGVVVGLLIGVGSVLYFAIVVGIQGKTLDVATDMPESDARQLR